MSGNALQQRILLDKLGDKCTCGAEITEFRLGQRHVDGNRDERLTFGCYAEWKYNKSFRAVEQTVPCPNTLEAKALLEKHVAAYARLMAYIDKLDVDPKYKKKLQEALEYKKP